MSCEKKENELYIVIISSKKERDELKDLCIKSNIPLTYPNLFNEKRVHSLWGINKNGIGLVGTVIARHTPKDHIVYSTNELAKIISKIN